MAFFFLVSVIVISLMMVAIEQPFATSSEVPFSIDLSVSVDVGLDKYF